MKVITINVPELFLDYIKMLTDEHPDLYPSRSECIRKAIEDWVGKIIELNNHAINEIRAYNQRQQEKILVPNGDGTINQYRIIRRLE